MDAMTTHAVPTLFGALYTLRMMLDPTDAEYPALITRLPAVHSAATNCDGSAVSPTATRTWGPA